MADGIGLNFQGLFYKIYIPVITSQVLEECNLFSNETDYREIPDIFSSVRSYSIDNYQYYII